MNFTKFSVTLFYRTFASKCFEKDSKEFLKEFILCDDAAFNNRLMTNRGIFRIQSNNYDGAFLLK